MKTHDVQSIAINKPVEFVFDYVANPTKLPDWTNAFASADAEKAEMVTPNGQITIRLNTIVNAECGTVDWEMIFPDGNVAKAFSRITADGEGCIYSFVLMAPPVPLEILEGELAQMTKILQGELTDLKELLEK